MPRLICPHCQKEFEYEPTEVAGEERSMPLHSFFERIENSERDIDQLLNENTSLRERVEKLERKLAERESVESGEH